MFFLIPEDDDHNSTFFPQLGFALGVLTYFVEGIGGLWADIPRISGSSGGFPGAPVPRVPRSLGSSGALACL